MTDPMATDTEHRVRDVLDQASRNATVPEGLAERIVVASRAGGQPFGGTPTATHPVRARLRSRRFLTSLSAAVIVAGLAFGASQIPWSDPSSSSASSSATEAGAAVAYGPMSSAAAASSAPGTSNGLNSAGSASQAAATEAARRSSARAFVAAMLRRVVLPSGSDARPSSPTPALDRSIGSIGGSNVVEQHAWWVVGTTVAETTADLESHPPVGLDPPTGYATSQPPVVEVINYPVSGPDAGISSGSIEFAITAYGSGSAIRVTVEAQWLPARTTAETIPIEADSVDVMITSYLRPAADVHRTLFAPVPTRLARLINSLDTAPAGEPSCPAPSITAKLTFHTGGQAPKTAFVGECGRVRIEVGSTGQPTLQDDGKVLPAILAELGLPATYGQR